MGLISLLKYNFSVIRAYNSCDQKQLCKIFDVIFNSPNWESMMTSKRYFHNLIRPKDFYKALSYYTIELVKKMDEESYGCMEIVDHIVHAVIVSAKDESIVKNFIWNVTKHAPLLTVETIRYMSSERVLNIIRSDKVVITDDILKPIVSEIRSLQKQNNELCALFTEGMI